MDCAAPGFARYRACFLTNGLQDRFDCIRRGTVNRCHRCCTAQFLTWYPVLKIHQTAARHAQRNPAIIAALVPMPTSASS